MTITCIPKKQLFYNPTNDYRVLSCIPLNQPIEMELNQYGSFTLSGSNLSSLAIDKEIELDIRQDQRSKYPASYILIGYNGIESTGENITIQPEKEFQLLCQVMEESQAKYVHQAYPDFICRVMNGQEETLDYHNIYNVGAIRLEDYINKIKANFTMILFMPVADKWRCNEPEIIKKLMTRYNTPDEASKAFEETPYKCLIYLAGFSFSRADRIVMENRPDLADSYERCEYGLLSILDENEEDGDTRLNANILARASREIIPECSSKIVEVVTTSPKIHYDSDSKYSAKEATYKAECNIARNILERQNLEKNLIPDNVIYENYRTLGGFECTDEQLNLLKVANEHKVCMLMGSAGTGKSSATKALIKMLDDLGKTYLLLAPTGVASKRLSEATNRQAYTIHMYLTRTDLHYSYDYILIDECSMVSVHLLSSLFDQINVDCNLVFVCDNAQLVSISCGNIVQDFVDSNVIPIVHLTKVFRYGIGGIATIATDTRNGVYGRNKEFTDYRLIQSNHSIQQIVDAVDDLVDIGYSLNDIMVLCPFNKGKIGSLLINDAIQNRFNAHKDTNAIIEINKHKVMFKVGDKVINTKNNYSAELVEWSTEEDEITGLQLTGWTYCGDTAIFNGDIGIVREVSEQDNKIIMYVEFDCGIVRFIGSEIAKLLLAYCISIHKSQGSQAKAVVVVIDKMHENMITRNLTYVADSRAQEYLVEIVDKYALESGLNRVENQERDTWLKELLME